MPGSRRLTIVWPGEVGVEAAEKGAIRVSFVLPAGSYATVLLREIMKTGEEAAVEAMPEEP